MVACPTGPDLVHLGYEKAFHLIAAVVAGVHAALKRPLLVKA